MNPRLYILFLVDKSMTQAMNIEPWERNYRSSHLQILFKISVLKNFANFTGKHLYWSLFLIKLQIWRLANLLWKDSNTGVMRKKLQKQSFTDILQNRCSKKFSNFHRKIHVSEYLFNKVADLKTSNFIKKDSSTGVFHRNLQNF